MADPAPSYDDDHSPPPELALLPAQGAGSFQQGLLGAEPAAIEGELDLKRLDRALVRRACVPR
jgi:hypothetical protein